MGGMLKIYCWGLVFLIMVFVYGGFVYVGFEEDYQVGLKSYWDGDVVGVMFMLCKVVDVDYFKVQVLFVEVFDRVEFDEDVVVYYWKVVV